MKRTIDVNIGGYVFHLDEDAYEKLNKYIESLKIHYNGSEEGKEIINDIESRIAELLHERKSGANAVVSLDEINEIVNILGNPEEIFEEEEPRKTYKTSKKLYRDAENRILGGVSSGIGAYFGLPVALIRILFIIFAFASLGIALLIYVILWIVTPKAMTPKQKLEMKGDPINVSNIEKSIKKEYSDVKENIKTKSPKIKKELNTFWERIHNFFLGIGKVILIVFGCLFVTIGVIALLSITGSLFITNWILIPFGDLPFYNIIPELLLNPSNSILFYISIFLVAGIPFILLLIVGLKLIFNFKTNTPLLVTSLICLWLFGIINIGLLTANQLKQYSQKTTNYSEPVIIEPSKGNTVYIKCNTNIKYKNNTNLSLCNINISEIDGKKYIFGQPELQFEKSETGNYEIIIKRESRGKDIKSANENIKNIDYQWNFKDSVIYLNRFFEVNKRQLWKAQKMDIIIKIPATKNIVIDSTIINEFNFNNDDFYDFYQNYNGTPQWIMKKSGKLQIVK